ncbi:DapH/DapD/GlmU-related protein [Williamsia herbipolensis]|uniref:DapH/DapD/GlmU-related protein n=1 Tax=Williamsia herbipolensis TaxID=1603258 RepID=UPI0006963359|nr:DapH/DapD/GlmU-related protein [Williamsia herbipolensis]
MTNPPALAADQLWPTTSTVREFIRRDRAANPRDPKAQLVLVLLRACQVVMRDRRNPTLPGKVLSAAYRALTEMVFGIELRPKTRVGPGVSIYHGYGLVVNDQCVIGSDVKLRNGVTIGHAHEGGPVPTIGDGVSFGAGAIALGGITIGGGATIAAGAVVVKSIPDGATAIGNPATVRPSPMR